MKKKCVSFCFSKDVFDDLLGGFGRKDGFDDLLPGFGPASNRYSSLCGFDIAYFFF